MLSALGAARSCPGLQDVGAAVGVAEVLEQVDVSPSGTARKPDCCDCGLDGVR